MDNLKRENTPYLEKSPKQKIGESLVQKGEKLINWSEQLVYPKEAITVLGAMGVIELAAGLGATGHGTLLLQAAEKLPNLAEAIKLLEQSAKSSTIGAEILFGMAAQIGYMLAGELKSQELSNLTRFEGSEKFHQVPRSSYVVPALGKIFVVAGRAIAK